MLEVSRRVFTMWWARCNTHDMQGCAVSADEEAVMHAWYDHTSHERRNDHGSIVTQRIGALGGKAF